MRKLVIFIWLLSSLSVLTAQNTDVKTVLFLIPFFSEEYGNYDESNMKTSVDIDNETVFSLVSFWEGAQLALDEYETNFQRLNIIVKDVTYNDDKLIEIMEDEELMNQVDMIIGPFFASQFEIAANYAKRYQIHIINPFTSKRSILDGNEYVYKVQSSSEAIAEMVKQRWLETGEETDILIWTERGADIRDLQKCEQYFTQLNIPYEFVIEGDKVSLNKRLSKGGRHVVMAFLPSETTIIARMRDMGIANDFPNTVFVIPEEWLAIGALEVDYLDKLNVHFFSDCFVSEDNDATLFFISNFIEKYNTPPDIKRFSFQGYDITKYFVELMLHNFDASRVQYAPVAMKFNFIKTENGGYENHGKFLLQLKDYKIQMAE
jgi:hypothetical protein